MERMCPTEIISQLVMLGKDRGWAKGDSVKRQNQIDRLINALTVIELTTLCGVTRAIAKQCKRAKKRRGIKWAYPIR